MRGWATCSRRSCGRPSCASRVGRSSRPNSADLAVLKELIEAGKLRPVVGRTYRLDDTPEALRCVGEGHARGKVVITV
jgi:NADPH:quinone reductase-like Zn-dependent oxidoreductase